jgi:hypothetical protein
MNQIDRQSPSQPPDMRSLSQPVEVEAQLGIVGKIDLVEQADAIERILQTAVQYELSIHKRLGNPIAAWNGDKVVVIPPEEIVLSNKSSEVDLLGRAK